MNKFILTRDACHVTIIPSSPRSVLQADWLITVAFQNKVKPPYHRSLCNMYLAYNVRWMLITQLLIPLQNFSLQNFKPFSRIACSCFAILENLQITFEIFSIAIEVIIKHSKETVTSIMRQKANRTSFLYRQKKRY